MAAAIRGYRMLLMMPEDLSIERAQTMKAFGAELILTPRSGGMEYARDLAEQMQRDGKGRVLDQFANADNPRVHYETTGPEIWADTAGRVTHFVSAMGTTGTITGVSRYLKEQNPAVRIVGAQPAEGSRIPGIRKWPEAYLPKIYDPSAVDELVLVSQADAEDDGAPAGARGGPVRRHLGRRCLLGGAADRAAGARTRPSSSSSATAATATCPPACSRHDAMAQTLPLLPALRHAAGDIAARRGRRRQGPAALPGLRLDALEQPDAGAGRRRRMRRPDGQVLLARNAAWTDRMFALITGFMEAGESPEEGIAREVAEETALRGAGHATLIGVYDFQRMNQVIIAYHVRGARRGPAVARTGRVQALRARAVRCWRAGTGLALADWLRARGHEPQFIELPPRDA